MEKGEVTPIPVDADSDPDVPGGATNPTILEKGASQRRPAALPGLPDRIGHY